MTDLISKEASIFDVNVSDEVNEDGSVDVSIDMSDENYLILKEAANEQNITIDQLIINVLKQSVKEDEK